MGMNKLSKSRYSFVYNDEDDILDLFFFPQSSYSEELYPGIYKRISLETDRMIGLTILDFCKRSASELTSKLPYKINFCEVKSKIMKA